MTRRDAFSGRSVFFLDPLRHTAKRAEWDAGRSLKTCVRCPRSRTKQAREPVREKSGGYPTRRSSRSQGEGRAPIHGADALAHSSRDGGFAEGNIPDCKLEPLASAEIRLLTHCDVTLVKFAPESYD